MRLKDKVAIVTGGGSGIGQAISKLFVQEGAKVVVADVNPDNGKQTLKLIKSSKRETQAKFIQTDVSKASEAENMVSFAVKEYRKLDILVNNAGIAMRKNVVELPESDWDRCININLKGIYLCSKFAIPEMIKSGGGSIINMSSIYGIQGAPIRAAYAASKGGVTILTKSMALDFAPYKIRVNCICPGFCDTPLVKAVVKTPEERQRLIDLHPLKRLATPEDIAYGALYLASDEALFVSGIALPIDGGFSAG
jgi:NAD(P)-dependent dehydrogenase (short-subunit alcohol dehydrogenase family)